MNENKRFRVNGIEVVASPVGGGLWAAVPVDIPSALLGILTGKINLADFLNPATMVIEDIEQETEQQKTEQKKTEQKRGLTIREYRKEKGISKTDFADYLGISRRTLGRWEDAGKKASEVGL